MVEYVTLGDCLAQDHHAGKLTEMRSHTHDIETHVVDARNPDQVDKVLQVAVNKHGKITGVASLVGNVMVRCTT